MSQAYVEQGSIYTVANFHRDLLLQDILGQVARRFLFDYWFSILTFYLFYHKNLFSLKVFIFLNFINIKNKRKYDFLKKQKKHGDHPPQNEGRVPCT